MRQTKLAIVVFAYCLASCCNADEPVQDLDRLLKQVCGGQWMINEDRHRLVQTHVEVDGSLRSRSYFVDFCFRPITRTEVYRYDKSTKKLTANIMWSNGSAWECDGEWNQDARTLTWTANLPTGIRTFTFEVLSPKITKYKIQETDTQGNLKWESSEMRHLLSE